MYKTEKEKMIAGEFYFAGDTELVSARKEAKRLMGEINEEDDDLKRRELVKKAFGKTGNNPYIEPRLAFDYGFNITVGDNFYCNYDNTFLDVAPITIGKNCMFGPNCQLYTAGHPIDAIKRNSGLEFGKPITIGDNVWLGGSVVLLPGVTLGNNVVVGAGSVVTKSFPDNVVIGGNPAQVIRQLGEDGNE